MTQKAKNRKTGIVTYNSVVENLRCVCGSRSSHWYYQKQLEISVLGPKMALQRKVFATNPDDMSLIPRSNVREGENRLLQVVHIYSHKQANKQTNETFKTKPKT